MNKITRKFKDNGPVTDGLFEVSVLPIVFWMNSADERRQYLDRRHHLQHRQRWRKQRPRLCYR